jgi:hypothetical protein
LFSAIATPTNTAPWIVVLNVDSGPGGSRAPGNSDVNYINGTAQLNAFGHVTSVGYVHLLNGNASVEHLRAGDFLRRGHRGIRHLRRQQL